jgi:phage repressor protein C with HTH and peptisase S24 domain
VRAVLERGVRELARERPLAAVVRGGSMAPLLADGDRVELGAVRWPLPGDVVAFATDDGRLVVHRLLGYRFWAGGLACVTRGDASPDLDPPVPRRRLLGRVVAPARALPTPALRGRALLAFCRRACGSLRSRLSRRG